MIRHRIRPEKITELRELAARTLAETYEPGPFYGGGGPGVWSGCIDAGLGGPAGEYCAAVHPHLLMAVLDELERLREEVQA